ncbi:DUF5666 domain-containing protein [Mycolicibacterium aichiense]|uniref:DUF5666 domain-containing protein n=1 Tax=Mycolicibacterium aichiense TaxID=1799 RepID=A0AAD1HMW0_9MYCO|nr:DUF5666 domain-containing protein [Mycolicibacterium aichiense]MCV7020423.1 hypothetical protein [Mycolicibacterium aichiense]BBX07934.1 hypothetical protein MAIC_27370 [Mycolicibacterium aichiense]STZ81744.1 27 kDa lipoprotein antigen [Mycolicibacterium aichiense]
MTLTIPESPTRCRRAVPILIGLIALSLAACGSSPTAATSSTQAAGSTTATAPAKGAGKDHVSGLITSVNGGTLAVSDKSVTSNVGFTSATKVSELTPAAVTDVTVGSCVSVRPARGSSPAPDGSVAAAAISVSAPRDGHCFAGARQQAGSTASTPPGGPAGHGDLRGTVASVSGGTLVVTVAGGTTPTNVTLSATTTYTKRAAADVQAIAQGMCVTARGTKDASGTLQASMIGLRPANNGSCPAMNR